MLALTNDDDWVFDPYAGVGSSLIAAVMHSRRAMGSEKEEQYVDITRERLTSYFNGTLRYRVIGTPVFEPTGKEKVSQVPDEWKTNPQKRLLEKKEKAYIGVIDVGIEIVTVKDFVTDMSSGVSYFEQFVWDLQHRGIADIDIPVLILGMAV